MEVFMEIEDGGISYHMGIRFGGGLIMQASGTREALGDNITERIMAVGGEIIDSDVPVNNGEVRQYTFQIKGSDEQIDLAVSQLTGTKQKNLLAQLQNQRKNWQEASVLEKEL